MYDSAENRDDQSEMDAILLATPNENWTKPDFALQAEQLLKLRLVLLVQRLKHCREAMFWLSLSGTEEPTKKSKKKDRFFYDSARLNAYFYCVSVDSANAIYEEIGLDIEAWETKRNELFGLDFVDEMTDLQMRNLAFDEKEVETFIKKIGKESGVGKIIVAFIYEKELGGLRKILSKQGFEELFKN